MARFYRLRRSAGLLLLTLGVSTNVSLYAEDQLPALAFPTGISSWEALAPMSAEAAGMEASWFVVQAVSPVPAVRHHLGADGLERIGVDFDFTLAIPAPQHTQQTSPLCQFMPRIFITEAEEVCLLRGSMKMGERCIAAAAATVIAPQCEMIVECRALEIEIHPLVEPNWLAVNDAAPLENPAAEIVQQLPAGDDAPAENPELETAAARIVSPTMSPDDYLAAFQDKLFSPSEPRGIVIPVAHEELITTPDCDKACHSPMLRALGGPISVSPCESETCRGFIIQFAPPAPPAAVAEAQAFDGPAQIMLHDAPNAPGQGFVWPAQPAGTLTLPVTHTESLDELADRLEREFLQRAVSGQIQCTPVCSDKCPTAAPQGAACSQEKCQANPCPTDKCHASQCQSDKCQPGACGLVDCPGCPAGSPCGACSTASSPCPSSPAQAAYPAIPPRSQWSLPTPAITINPYAQGPEACAMPTFAHPHGAMVMGPQPQRVEWAAAAHGPIPGPAVCHTPATLAKSPVTGETLETYRDISRTLGHLAERCEAQGLYDRADELRDLAQEYRMSARVVHGHLSALSVPQPFMDQSMFGQLPMLPYPGPSMYQPEPAPALAPPPAPLVPAGYPQPLPIARPMMPPRY